MAILTPEIIHHVARLARLRLEGPALTQLATQLEEIVQYVRQLEAVDTEQVNPTSHVLELSNVLRQDACRPSLSQDAVLTLAPARRQAYVAVPKVIET